MRSVAQAADVDPTLVNYYFTNKSGLLKAALEPPEAFGAGIPSEQVVRLIAPTVQHYLTGALGEDLPANA